MLALQILEAIVLARCSRERINATESKKSLSFCVLFSRIEAVSFQTTPDAEVNTQAELSQDGSRHTFYCP